MCTLPGEFIHYPIDVPIAVSCHACRSSCVERERSQDELVYGIEHQLRATTVLCPSFANKPGNVRHESIRANIQSDSQNVGEIHKNYLHSNVELITPHPHGLSLFALTCLHFMLPPFVLLIELRQ